MAIPAVDVQKPKTATAGTATHMCSVATATIAASAPGALELPSATHVSSDARARWPSQRPPKMAPPPIAEARIERPPARSGTRRRRIPQQLVQRPSAHAQRDQQNEKSRYSGMRCRVTDALPHIRGEASLRGKIGERRRNADARQCQQKDDVAQGIGRECRGYAGPDDRQACKHRTDEAGQVEHDRIDRHCRCEVSLLHERRYEGKPGRLVERDHDALEGCQGDEKPDVHLAAGGECEKNGGLHQGNGLARLNHTQPIPSVSRSSCNRPNEKHGKEIGKGDDSKPQAGLRHFPGQPSDCDPLHPHSDQRHRISRGVDAEICVLQRKCNQPSG